MQGSHFRSFESKLVNTINSKLTKITSLIATDHI